VDKAADQATRPTVTVRGEAVLRTAPDEALLSITINAVDATPGGALTDVATRNEKLVSILDELGVPAADRATAGVSVGEDVEHTQEGRRSLGHRASARTVIRTIDPQLIGLLIERSTSDLAAQVDGPIWRIAQANPVRLQAAKEAAADGSRKAEAYAEGVGATVGPLLEMVEADAHTAPVIRAASSNVKRMPIETGEQEVSAAVYVTFALRATEA
jgi:uncharacterized protein